MLNHNTAGIQSQGVFEPLNARADGVFAVLIRANNLLAEAEYGLHTPNAGENAPFCPAEDLTSKLNQITDIALKIEARAERLRATIGGGVAGVGQAPSQISQSEVREMLAKMAASPQGVYQGPR